MLLGGDAGLRLGEIIGPATLDSAIRLLEPQAGPASAFAHRATADKEAGHYVDSRGDILETEGGETAKPLNETRRLVDQTGTSWNLVVTWLRRLDVVRGPA